MNIDFYLNQACPRGSAFYYSLRSVKAPKRHALILIQAFYLAIKDSLLSASDAAITRIRLQWWRDEIDRAYKQEATHPVAQAIGEIISPFALPKKLFFGLINGFENYLDNSPFEKEEDAIHFLIQTAGNREQLFFHISGLFQKMEQCAALIGQGLERIYLLRHCRRLTDLGHFFFAQEHLDLTESTIEDIATRQSQKLLAFFELQSNLAKQDLHEAMRLLLPYKKQQRYQLIRIRLALATLREIEKGGFLVLQGYLKLNPIRKLWMSLL